MKEEEVPQDDGACYEGQFQRVTFAVAEDGSYKGVVSKGWEAEIGANSVSTDRSNERIQAAWEQVKAGSASPLAYHMAAHMFDATHLATEIGTWTWRVRRHCKPGPWKRLSTSWKQCYADVFGMEPAQLEHVPDEPETV